MFKCLIIDDEEPARKLIGLHLSALDNFEVVASLSNGLDAFTFLQKNHIDLVFLDINMPGISGLELIRSLKVKPKIILTTAFREFAANAYDLDVLDYIVKPITRDRFMKAISKYLHYYSFQEGNKQQHETFVETHRFFKDGRDKIKIFLKDIIYIEGFSDYVKVHTKSKSYVVSEKLNYLEESLPEDQFSRIHKSFIIALDKITNYTASQVTLGVQVLPIGRLFKGIFMKKFEQKSIS